jgi:hypothetical protein
MIRGGPEKGKSKQKEKTIFAFVYGSKLNRSQRMYLLAR